MNSIRVTKHNFFENKYALTLDPCSDGSFNASISDPDSDLTSVQKNHLLTDFFNKRIEAFQKPIVLPVPKETPRNYCTCCSGFVFGVITTISALFAIVVCHTALNAVRHVGI